MTKKEKDKKVIFRRIGGRIVPITIAVTGAGVAADAARTKRIYQKGNTTIDRKSGVFDLGTKRAGKGFVMKKGGKTVGVARTYIDKGTKDLGFSWIGVNKKFRGMGLSKELSKEAVRDAVRDGAKTTSSQVIHEGSLLTNYNKKRDTLFFNYRTNKSGTGYFKEVSKKDALKEIKRARKEWSDDLKRARKDSFFNMGAAKKRRRNSFGGYKKMLKGDIIDNLKTRIEQRFYDVRYRGRQTYRSLAPNFSGKPDSRIFRETNLKGIKRTTKYAKVFRTTGNKAKIAVGIAAALGGTVQAFRLRNEKK